jgi:pimeloyl-ACP methyl ester carboxylesterase
MRERELPSKILMQIKGTIMTQIRANGIDIEFESFGREGDPAVLLIAGFTEQLTGWPDSLCYGLAAKRLRVICFDNRDAGKSTHLTALGAPAIPEIMAKMMSGQKIEPPYSLDDMAADAVGLLEALGIGPTHIVGASMGGMIAQLVAANYPAKTKSLVSMMSGTGRRDLPPPKREAMAALLTRPSSSSRESRIDWFIHLLRAVGGPDYRADDAELRAYAERNVDRAPLDLAAVARQTAALFAAEPRDQLLRSVHTPTLVLGGADDPLAPVEWAKDTAESVAGAELVIVPGLGHDFTEAAVERVYLKYIGDFISKVEASAKSV